MTVEAPNGTYLPVKRLGRFHASAGEYVYHFDVHDEGEYKLRAGRQLVSRFRTHPDRCNCPEPAASFRARFTCNPLDDRELDRVFARWGAGSVSYRIFTNREQMNVFDNFAHVTIVNNTMYYKLNSNRTEPGHPFWKWSMWLLQSLLRKVHVPDCEFFHGYNLDAPHMDVRRPVPPVLSYGISADTAEVGGPTAYHAKWIESGEALRFAAKAPPWHRRKPVAFFRGGPTGRGYRRQEHMQFNPRFRLVMETCRNHSAGGVGRRPRYNTRIFLPREYVTSQYDKRTLAWLNANRLVTYRRVPEIAASKYKYILNADGNGAAWRMHYLLGLGSLLIKQDSPLKEYWYDELLEEGSNHVRTGYFYDDIDAVVGWARRHDDLARRMASNAFHTWMQRARPEDAYCWLAGVLERISRASGFRPQVRKGMKCADDELPKDTCDCQW